jgi:hypothetical protein
MTIREMDIINKIDELPYNTSPPIQFTYAQSAALTLGQYPFLAAVKNVMGYNGNITSNALYYLRNLSFACDIPELDYQQALKLAGGTVNIPRFNMFFSKDAHSPIIPNALQLNQFFDGIDFKQTFSPRVLPNDLKGNITGTLQQTANLAGVNEINATVELFFQEITDDNFIAHFRKRYPEVVRK